MGNLWGIFSAAEDSNSGELLKDEIIAREYLNVE